MANSGISNSLAARTEVSLAPGFSVLDPTLPKKGIYHRRWRLLVNFEVKELLGARDTLSEGRSIRGIGQVMAKISADEILTALDDNRDAIKAYGVRRLGLFGSYARGEDTETSDLDFIVEFEKKTFDAYMDLKAFLERLFQRKVDLVLTDAIKPRLRTTILNEAVYGPRL